ncbi:MULTISPECIES: DDE-type integrase/transposase/recombinase [unclassified Methylosinus]|uniref:DDE-type integrase/transposase/recombinase n=1 Tax=unclassified Methylosinus TaxID=2624500 RepID=UPI000A013F27|nr:MULTISPECIES: DDE-type integrase/transposase/recombinase [unclassified Methylosinus]
MASHTRFLTVPDFLLHAKQDVAAAKACFRGAFARHGPPPRKIRLDGYQASHRAAREVLAQHRRGAPTRIRSSKYLNNRIEQDHRSTKLRLGPMLGLERFRHAAITIVGVELMHRIRKGRSALSRSRTAGTTAPKSGVRCSLPDPNELPDPIA